MSRIGKMPIQLTAGVTAQVGRGEVVIKGPKGELTIAVPLRIGVALDRGQLLVEKKGNDRELDALHGTIRALLANAVTGVTQGWKKELELSGVGYRATVNGADLVLLVGFSHPVTVKPPSGIAIAVQEGKIVVSGIDKHLVGQVAANIRAVKPPEPYKGKGIKYVGEYIKKKAGKSAKGVGGTPGIVK